MRHEHDKKGHILETDYIYSKLMYVCMYVCTYYLFTKVQVLLSPICIRFFLDNEFDTTFLIVKKQLLPEG